MAIDLNEKRCEVGTRVTHLKVRTGAEIEELKAQWIRDPCWDIETTEGFEAHHFELRKFRRATEAEWKANAVPERYRGKWFWQIDREDIAAWLNEQAAQGYLLREMRGVVHEIYVLVERKSAGYMRHVEQPEFHEDPERPAHWR
jgi:hypothetical protein